MGHIYERVDGYFSHEIKKIKQIKVSISFKSSMHLADSDEWM